MWCGVCGVEGAKLIYMDTDWNAVGIRTEGRPKNMWRDEVEHDMKKGKLRNLMHLVKAWRDLVHQTETHVGGVVSEEEEEEEKEEEEEEEEEEKEEEEEE